MVISAQLGLVEARDAEKEKNRQLAASPGSRCFLWAASEKLKPASPGFGFDITFFGTAPAEPEEL